MHRLFYIQSVLVLSAVYSRDVSEMVVQKPLAFTKHSNLLSDSFSRDKANLRNLETLSSQQLVAKSFEKSSMRSNFEAGGLHTIDRRCIHGNESKGSNADNPTLGSRTKSLLLLRSHKSSSRLQKRNFVNFPVQAEAGVK